MRRRAGSTTRKRNPNHRDVADAVGADVVGAAERQDARWGISPLGAHFVQTTKDFEMVAQKVRMEDARRVLVWRVGTGGQGPITRRGREDAALS